MTAAAGCRSLSGMQLFGLWQQTSSSCKSSYSLSPMKAVA